MIGDMMRITLDIDDELLNRVRELTGIGDLAVLLRMALELLIARKSAARLADLGGTEKKLRPIRRRRGL
jgi:hypothetical protein